MTKKFKPIKLALIDGEWCIGGDSPYWVGMKLHTEYSFMSAGRRGRGRENDTPNGTCVVLYYDPIHTFSRVYLPGLGFFYTSAQETPQ